MQLSFAPIVKRTAPAVVNVYAQRGDEAQGNRFFDDPFFRRFFGDDGSFGRPRERVQNSLGSGVIVDPAGLIVTNNHVIANGTDIKVVLADRREFEAKVLLTDERTDLAVLKIDVPDEELPALPLGDSDALEVGDLVLAIGNPVRRRPDGHERHRLGPGPHQGGRERLSVLHPDRCRHQPRQFRRRARQHGGRAHRHQHGDLLALAAVRSVSALPSRPTWCGPWWPPPRAAAMRSSRPWLGVELQDVTADIATSLGMARPEGALIVSLHPESPLAKAGLKRGDVILAIEGKPVENAQELGYRVATTAIGATTIVEYQRRGDRKRNPGDDGGRA